MEEIDVYFIFYMSVFVLIFIIDYFFILKRKVNHIKYSKKIDKKVKIIEVDYLSFKFKLNKIKLYENWIIFWMAFINSFIISLVSTVVSFINLDMIWQLMIGFVLLMGLIYSLYEIFGRYLVKKGLY